MLPLGEQQAAIEKLSIQTQGPAQEALTSVSYLSSHMNLNWAANLHLH
jgi:hypothetical protein